MKRFAAKVDALLSASGMSQADLARACGLSQQNVNEWFRKQGRMPKADQIMTVARTLGVTADYLLDDGQEEPAWVADGEKCRQVIEAIRSLGVGEAWKRLLLAPPVEPTEKWKEETKPAAGGRRADQTNSQG